AHLAGIPIETAGQGPGGNLNFKDLAQISDSQAVQLVARQPRKSAKKSVLRVRRTVRTSARTGSLRARLCQTSRRASPPPTRRPPIRHYVVMRIVSLLPSATEIV